MNNNIILIINLKQKLNCVSEHNTFPSVTLLNTGLNAVACLSHTGSAETQKPRNTHATIEVRVSAARCWVTHATVERVAAPRLACCYATQR
jgi:hypothetical protein